ncbi:restriction endonuclease subunit S [Rhodopirellula bahusiensis]|uniref:Type I restriction modification DNA specificity domain-containing protein n=1 Tax=Rhodopirellula bahusiensis TaxID=2014065 RepID=A0A2G1W544_9BACT|nr:restriction endonuclease subunit S [Rhodopirellula bahusiensis]PHQ34153.1 hypothetical protein CEE69_15995 [Rhodopirellula bahusiensis]
MSETLHKPLASLCSLFTDGDWIESKDQSPKGIRLIQTGNVGVGEFKDRRDKARFISNATFARLNCEEIFEGDCLISRLPDPCGRACVIPDCEDRMVTAVDCTIARFDSSVMIVDYFRYYSQSQPYLSAVERECTGATRKRISRKNLGKVEVPVPPLHEQRRIVSILDEALGAIGKAKENTERNLANAKELFASYLDRVFTRPNEGWEETTLGEACVLKSGTTVNKALEKSVGDVPYVKVADMNHEGNESEIVGSSRYLLQSDVKPNSVFPVGTTIFPKRGGAILTNKKRLTKVPICCDLNIMGVIPPDSINPHFLFFYFVNVDMRELGSGSTIPQINNYDIDPLPIFVPSPEVQKSTVEKLLLLLAEVEKLEHCCKQKLWALSELKQSILQKAFTGQLTAKSSELELVP